MDNDVPKDTPHIPQSAGIECVSESLEDEIFSTEFGAYLLVMTAALLMIVWLVVNVMGDFIVFTEAIGFPGQKAYILGTLLTFLVLTYAVFKIGHHYKLTGVIMAFLFFLFFYTLWTTNLLLTAEFFVDGANATTNASFYLISAIISLLVIMYYASCLSPFASLLVAVPLVWCMYMLYKWWFRYANQQKTRTDCSLRESERKIKRKRYVK